MSFFQELQRRKVIRTVIAYVVAAFAVAQGTQLLVEALALPREILKAVVVIAIVALPAVIVLAWMFDASSRGLQPADTSGRSISWGKFAIAGVVVLAGVIGAIAVFTMRGSRKDLDANLIAILPFRVTGTADLAFLREGMVDLLATKLTGERGMRAADPRNVLSALGQKQLTDTKLGDGRSFATSLGAGQVLTGSIVGTARHFTITAALIDVATNRRVPAQVEGTLDSLTAVVDRLAGALLSLQAGEGTQRLTALTSTSLPALRAYLDAQAEFRVAHFHKAVQLYATAVDLDSTFALAAMGHILSSGWDDVPDETVDRSKRYLVQNLNRLGPVDRLVGIAVAGDHYPDRRSVRERVRAWEAVLDKAPDRPDAWFEYGDQLTHYGPLAEYSPDDSLPKRAFERALRLDSMNILSLLHLSDFAVMRGDRETVTRLDARRTRLDPTAQAGRYQAGWRARLLGDSTALQALRAATDTSAFYDLWALILAPAIVGTGVGDALFAIEKWLARATTAEEKRQVYLAAHDAYLVMGMPSRAARMLRARRALETNQVEANVIAVADALFADGDAGLGEEAVAALRRVKDSSSALEGRAAAACFVDQWELLHGRSVDVSADVRMIQQAGVTGQDTISANLCALLLRALHADVAKQADAAARLDALDVFLRPGPPANPRLLMVANLLTSRLYERRGDRASALRAIRRRAFSLDAFQIGLTSVREEARLAGIAGDQKRAVFLYQRYLGAHAQAEPALKANNDAARRDLARLTAER